MNNRDGLRLLLIGSPGTPIFEVGERLCEFHDLPFVAIERYPAEVESYLDDIPEKTLDMGDMSAGSNQSQMARDPKELEKEKRLKKPAIVGGDYASITDEELGQIMALDQAIVVSQVPDERLLNWCTHMAFFNTADKYAIEWFSKRRFCPACESVYHLEEKPSQYFGVCDRCGTDLIFKEEDGEESVRKEYEKWRQLFWRLQQKAKEKDGYRVYAVDKYKNLEELAVHVNRDYKKYIKKGVWYYDLLGDMQGRGSGPDVYPAEEFMRKDEE